MKHLLLLLPFLGLCTYVRAQHWEFEKPDYDRIEANIREEASHLYYPSLMKRFLEADSTLTLTEKRHLYYGYVFQESYAPYSSPETEEKFRALLRKEQLQLNDLKEIVRYGDLLFEQNPLDFQMFGYQLYALRELGEQEKYARRDFQYNLIFEVILSSGDGTSKEYAFSVIEPSHEYEILRLLGFRFGGQQSLTEHYDYLEVDENEYGLEGLFFDVSPSLEYLAGMR